MAEKIQIDDVMCLYGVVKMETSFTFVHITMKPAGLNFTVVGRGCYSNDAAFAKSY